MLLTSHLSDKNDILLITLNGNKNFTFIVKSFKILVRPIIIFVYS